MKDLAINDKNEPFSDIAFRWEDDIEMWSILCVGRTREEFKERLLYWKGKGQDMNDVKIYSCHEILLTQRG